MESAAVQMNGAAITQEHLTAWPIASANDFLLLCAAIRLREGGVEYASFCKRLEKQRLKNQLVYINSAVTPPNQKPRVAYVKQCFPLLADAEALVCWWTAASPEAREGFCDTLRACRLALVWTSAAGWRLISDERY